MIDAQGKYRDARVCLGRRFLLSNDCNIMFFSQTLRTRVPKRTFVEKPEFTEHSSASRQIRNYLGQYSSEWRIAKDLCLLGAWKKYGQSQQYSWWGEVLCRIRQSPRISWFHFKNERHQPFLLNQLSDIIFGQCYLVMVPWRTLEMYFDPDSLDSKLVISDKKLVVSDKIVNPHDFIPVITEPEFCRQRSANPPFMLIYTQSAPGHFELRQKVSAKPDRRFKEQWVRQRCKIRGNQSTVHKKVRPALVRWDGTDSFADLQRCAV